MTLPRIVAHRCGGALAPENSLAGLAIAARLGCRGVEFDVMLTADDAPVLMHDDTLDRTTDGHGPVAALTLAQLRQFDAGGRHHPAYAVSPAPTLGEALAECARLGLWANVEIKPTPGRERATGRLVARQVAAVRSTAGVTLSSFSAEALIAARDAAPALPRALLVEQLPLDWACALSAVGTQALHCAAQPLLVAPDGDAIVAPILAAGIRLACYTVNRRGEAERLFAAGVAAVFTDRPDLWSPAEM